MFSPISDQQKKSEYQPQKEYKYMTEDQFEEIVDAVLAGKYSWACVLILQFGGYNPLHYIPYRTYNRLIKNNRLNKGNKTKESHELSQNQRSDKHKESLSGKFKDLNYLEKVQRNSEKISGGLRIQWNFTY